MEELKENEYQYLFDDRELDEESNYSNTPNGEPIVDEETQKQIDEDIEKNWENVIIEYEDD